MKKTLAEVVYMYNATL